MYVLSMASFFAKLCLKIQLGDHFSHKVQLNYFILLLIRQNSLGLPEKQK